MSEFSGLWNNQNNPASSKSVQNAEAGHYTEEEEEEEEEDDDDNMVLGKTVKEDRKSGQYYVPRLFYSLKSLELWF